MSEIKQVIVMRTDLNMRKGKMIAQGAHASIAFLHEQIVLATNHEEINLRWISAMIQLSTTAVKWFWQGMTKICVRCESEKELTDIACNAREAGLYVHVITDAGHTEFNGVPTKTCLAIGPNNAVEIDKITGKLKLL